VCRTPETLRHELNRARREAPGGFVGVNLMAECQTSDFHESFCIQDALLRAVKLGDTELGLSYTGQSVTRIPEFSLAELKSAQELVTEIEDGVARLQNRYASAYRSVSDRHCRSVTEPGEAGLPWIVEEFPYS